MRIPITDAFDNPDSMEELEVAFTPEQMEWLAQKAEDRNLSIGHLLRAMVEEKRNESASSASSFSGDGVPHAVGTGEGPRTRTEETDSGDAEGASTLIEELRSANERLQNLTNDDEEKQEGEAHETIARLAVRANEASGSDATGGQGGTEASEERHRSMFDLVEE